MSNDGGEGKRGGGPESPEHIDFTGIYQNLRDVYREAHISGQLVIDVPAGQSGVTFPLSNPDRPCPSEILQSQIQLRPLYWGFDGRLHQGLIEINRKATADVSDFFALAYARRFPVERVLPSSHPDFGWDDDKLMAANVTSGFNYRLIAGSDQPSLHGLGLAFDVNPHQNPYIRYENGEAIMSPPGAVWDPSVPGTLHAHHVLVKFMESRGWQWGGHWTPDSGRTDYQHFQKPCSHS